MKSIDRMVVAAVVCLAGAALAGTAVADDPAGQAPASAPASAAASGQKDAENVIAAWPEKTKTAAQALIDKYGSPDGVTDKMLSWNDRDPWTMVAVYRDAVSHSQPTAHQDFIENKISYTVPENKVAELLRFDRELVVDQIRGTLAVHGESEQNNVLALNLANEIVTDKRNVASAKSFLKKTLEESMAGKSSSYTEGLMFTPTPSANPMPGETPAEGTEPGTQTPQ